MKELVQEPLYGLLELEAALSASESSVNSERFTAIKEFVEVEYREVPMAVRVGDRALALDTIMTFYNLDNRVAGSAKAVKNPNSRFCRLYGSAADKVQQGAEKNRNELLLKFREATGTLAATDALRANGYDEADSELAAIVMRHDLNEAYGANSNATADDRNKLAARAQELAEKLGIQQDEDKNDLNIATLTQ